MDRRNFLIFSLYFFISIKSYASMYKTKIFKFIKSNKFLSGKENSVYSLASWKNLLYVGLYRSNEVLVINTINNTINQILPIHSPHGIILDNFGNLYVASMLEGSISFFKKNRINKYRLIKKIKNNDLAKPVSIAYSNNNLYIVNWASHNIVVTNKEFDFLKIFYFNPLKSKPHSITYLDKRLYITYRSPPSIVILDESGNLLFDKDLGSNFDPLSITHYKNYFLIPNAKNGQIAVFDKNLNNHYHIEAGNGLPTYTTVIGDEVYISEENGNRIFRINDLLK